MSTRRLLLIVCAFGVGVAAASLFWYVREIPVDTMIAIAACVLFLTIIFRVFDCTKLAFFFLFILCCLLGIVRTNISFLSLSSSALADSVQTKVTLTGIIVGDLDRRQESTKFTFSVAESREKILITTDRRTPLEHGDIIEVTGKLDAPEPFETDTGRIFNYPMYLAKSGITYLMRTPEIKVVEESHWSIARTLFRLKEKLISSAGRFIPYPEEGLLSGILYGERGGLSQETLKDFRTTGIVHVVVLSGANVTLIAVFLLNIFSRVSRRFGLVMGIIGIICFAIMTGGGTTTLRASIMALLAVGTQWFGREYNITRALAFAGFFMILQNPLTLIYDISFRLSFLATIGLVYIGPMIEKYIRWMPERFELRSNLLATLSTQIFVLPLLTFTTGQISLISIIVNLIALPFIPYAMLGGFITALLGLVSGIIPGLVWIAAIPTYLFLTIPLRIVDIFSEISWASVTLPQIPIWVLVICYIFLFWVVVYKNKDRG